MAGALDDLGFVADDGEPGDTNHSPDERTSGSRFPAAGIEMRLENSRLRFVRAGTVVRDYTHRVGSSSPPRFS
jgi:hypothetical protein